jgi:hypothetical protein
MEKKPKTERRATVEVWLAGKEKFFRTTNTTAAEMRAKARTLDAEALTTNGSLPKMSPALMDRAKKPKWRESRRSEMR